MFSSIEAMTSLRDLGHLYEKCEELGKRYSLLKTFFQVQEDFYTLVVNNAKICWNNYVANANNDNDLWRGVGKGRIAVFD